jgi:hypothetical protein
MLSLSQEKAIKDWCAAHNVDEPYSANLKCTCCGERLIDWRRIVLTSEGPVGRVCSAHFPERRCHGRKGDAE